MWLEPQRIFTLAKVLLITHLEIYKYENSLLYLYLISNKPDSGRANIKELRCR